LRQGKCIFKKEKRAELFKASRTIPIVHSGPKRSPKTVGCKENNAGKTVERHNLHKSYTKGCIRARRAFVQVGKGVGKRKLHIRKRFTQVD
jgi:hypothetical protein